MIHTGLLEHRQIQQPQKKDVQRRTEKLENCEVSDAGKYLAVVVGSYGQIKRDTHFTVKWGDFGTWGVTLGHAAVFL